MRRFLVRVCRFLLISTNILAPTLFLILFLFDARLPYFFAFIPVYLETLIAVPAMMVSLFLLISPFNTPEQKHESNGLKIPFVLALTIFLVQLLWILRLQ